MEKKSTQNTLNISNVKQIKIQDFCDMQLFEQIIENWCISTGLGAAVVDNDGNYIGRYYNFTDFCQSLTRQNPEGLRRCRESDKKGYGTYVCHAGLVDSSMDIVLEDGTVLGRVLGGQVLPEKPDEAKFRATARELGIDENTYIAALHKVNIRTPKEIRAAAQLLGDVVNMFVRTSWNSRQDAKTLLERARIISSLSKIFFCNYYVDLQEDKYWEIDAIDDVSAKIDKTGKAAEAFLASCAAFVHARDQKEYLSFTDVKTVAARLSNRHSITFEFIGQNLRWNRATFIAVDRDKDKVPWHVLFAGQDIQEEKEQELEIHKTLKKAADDANKANQVKSDFLARMSHDMRTPLTTIIGLCDIANDHYTDNEILKYFHTIKDSSEFLLSILTDILDMQKMASGKVVLQPMVCHNAVTAMAVERIIRPLAEAKNITLKTDFLCQTNHCYFNIDTRRVQQVMMNLLNNAVKYTQPGGTIEWKCRILEDDKATTIIEHTIADNGPGMSPEFMNIMYEPFTQVNSSPTSNGHGLGLAIVKKLVDLMGATIKCESQLGKGTTFTLTVPHAKAAEAEIEAYKRKKQIAEAQTGFQGCRVLVCEDNHINAEIIKKILQNRQMLVDIAKNGGEGVQLAQTKKYDAILMDIRMPILDGYAATGKIREFDKNIPIIALSANNFPEDIEKSLAAGMNAHLAKPIDIKKLFGTLHEVLAHKI